MIQHIKSLLVGLTKEFGSNETSSALGYGLTLAQQTAAHVTVQAASVKLVLTGAWLSGFGASLVQAENRRLHTLAEAAAQSAAADAEAAGVICSTESPHLNYPDLLESFATQARLHDLTVLEAEPDVLKVDRGLIETLLIASGRPLLVVPPHWEIFSAKRIVLAWDGSARAARAAGDALPFMRAAEAVHIVSVAGEKEMADTVSGAEIAPHLSRHGVSVVVNCVACRNGDVAETLRESAKLFEAEMIVMGGFVHSRLRELMFGGVTQSLLTSSPLPLFMSH